MGHIPREISRYVYFFIKEENGKVLGTSKSLKFKVSPILSGGLEVPLSLTFSCKEKWVIDTMEEFVENSFECSGNLPSTDDTNASNDEEDNDYYTITLGMEDVKEEKDEPEQVDLKIDNNLDIPIVIDGSIVHCVVSFEKNIL